MPSLPALLLGAAAAWAGLSLAVQARRALRRRPDHAAPAGSGAAGVLYSFTLAMTPARKESIGRHPLAFALGAALHLGVAAALWTAAASVVAPRRPSAFATPPTAAAALGLAAGAALVAFRLARPAVRRLSTPDDYLASGLVGLCLAAALGFRGGAVSAGGLQLVAAALLLYVPLGKLRHCVFFFLARGRLGWRLGRRGVYPPRRRSEAAHDAP